MTEQRRAARAGARLQAARNDRGWSQTQLAEAITAALGGNGTVGQSTISSWENGEATPSHTKWPVIEDVLELQPGVLSRFYGGQDVKNWQEISAVPEAIESDPFLGPAAKDALLRTYRALVGH